MNDVIYIDDVGYKVITQIRINSDGVSEPYDIYEPLN